jgi:hypothetical protein
LTVRHTMNGFDQSARKILQPDAGEHRTDHSATDNDLDST